MPEAVAVRLLSNDPKRTEADVQSDIKELLLLPQFGLDMQQTRKLEVQTEDNTRPSDGHSRGRVPDRNDPVGVCLRSRGP
jgi:hypothetical protein